MASPRITKVMREGIVKNTIEHTYNKEETALDEREYKLADKAYHVLYSKAQIAHMEALGERFINKNIVISVNLGGLRNRLELKEPRFMEDSQYCNPVVADGKLREDIEKFFDDSKEHSEKVNRASVNLMAMLESVQSFKKLRAVWPEGEKFYDMYDVDSEKPGVPAVIVQDINKMLGLK